MTQPPVIADPNKFTDIRIVNLTRGEQPPEGYTVIASYPGQFVDKQMRLTKQTTEKNNYGHAETKQEHEEVVNLVETVFLLCGLPIGEALTKRQEEIADLRASLSEASFSAHNTEQLLRSQTARAVELEAEIVQLSRNCERNRDSALASEKLAGDLRNQIDRLTKHFGKGPVDTVLAK